MLISERIGSLAHNGQVYEPCLFRIINLPTALIDMAYTPCYKIVKIMELKDKILDNLEDNVKGMVDKHTFNKVWYDVVISLIHEIRILRKKYE